MLTHASVPGQHRSKLQRLLTTASRLGAIAPSAGSAKERREKALHQTLAHVDHAQVSALLAGEARLQTPYGLLGLQSIFGNQARQSMLNHRVASPEPEGKVCSCGGTCPECSHSVPPGEQPDEDQLTVQSRFVDSNAVSSCGLHDWMTSPQSGDTDGLVHQGSGTVVCDGTGDYRVDMGWGATAGCGVGDCVRKHEESHIADLRVRYPDGCKNPDGTSKPDGTPHPTGGPGYDAWLRKTECKAYNVELECEQALLKTTPKDCKVIGDVTLERVVDDRKEQAKKYCSGGC